MATLTFLVTIMLVIEYIYVYMYVSYVTVIIMLCLMLHYCSTVQVGNKDIIIIIMCDRGITKINGRL